jgi:hypothetical protein
MEPSMHSHPALRVVDLPQPPAFSLARDEAARSVERAESLRSDALAEQLWTEHGWGLSAQHVAILLIAIFTASVCLRLLN